MGLLVFTVIMQAIFLYYKDASFETAAFYSLFTAVVFTLPTIVSGMVSWWVNYELAKTKIFMNKLIFSFILLAMGIVEVAIRITHPHLADGSGGLGMFYNVMLFLNIPVLAVVGFNGGKLSWG
jgi:uncharacterized membrane protein